MPSTTTAYRPDIDGLRAIAVIAVVMFHLDATLLPGGFTGVDVFFVISGYVVTASLLKRQGETLSRFLIGFYGRRIARIVPALAVMLGASLLLYALFIPIPPWGENPEFLTGVYAFVGASNIALLLSGADYFAGPANLNPWLHTWSLGIEEQYYLLTPPLVFWWLRRRDTTRTWALLPLGLCALLSLTACIWLQGKDANLAFYLVMTRFWELASGALLCMAQASSREPRRLPSWGVTSLATLGVVLLALALQTTEEIAMPLPGALLPVAGTLLLVSAGSHGSTGFWIRVLSLPPMVAIGRMSYSLYLWHWPVFVGLRWTLELESTSSRILAVALSLVLAVLSYRWVEQPTRHAAWLTHAPSARALAASLLLMLSGFSVGWVLWETRADLSFSEVTKMSGRWGLIWREWTTKDSPCSVTHKDEGLIDTREPEDCRYSEESPPPRGGRLFALGDSHTMHLAPAFEHLTGEGITVTSLAKPSCGYLLVTRPMRSVKPVDCRHFDKTRILELLSRAAPGDWVLLSSLRMNRYEDRNAVLPTMSLMEEEAWQWLEPLLAKGLRVIITAPLPVFPQRVWRCLDPWLAGKPSCQTGLVRKRDELLARRAAHMRILQELVARYPAVQLWDPFPLLCPDSEYCRAIQKGVPVYSDGDHLTPHGVRLIYPSLVALLRNTPDEGEESTGPHGSSGPGRLVARSHDRGLPRGSSLAN
jgi:peptidoglycan/LPS O-acetylase OafA/YrhL